MTSAALAVATAALLAISTVTPESGVASQYSPNVMQRVVSNRQRMSQLPPTTDPIYMTIAGFIAACD